MGGRGDVHRGRDAMRPAVAQETQWPELAGGLNEGQGRGRRRCPGRLPGLGAEPLHWK